MKKLSISLATLVFAATAAHAQDASTQPADQDAAAPTAESALPEAPAADVPPAAPDAVPPAADAGVAADAAAPAPAAPPAAAAPAQGAPAPAPVPQAGVSASAVSDAEVQSYAQATVKVQEIAKNAALDEAAKQQQMAAAVTEAGLDPERFNEITTAINADTALRTRIQTALAAHSAAHQG